METLTKVLAPHLSNISGLWHRVIRDFAVLMLSAAPDSEGLLRHADATYQTADDSVMLTFAETWFFIARAQASLVDSPLGEGSFGLIFGLCTHFLSLTAHAAHEDRV